MITYIAVVTLIICMVFLALQIRNNENKLKMKKEYGEVIVAKVISWNVVPGRPDRDVIKDEYTINEKKENKSFVTSGKFAKKYEHDRNIQIVTIPNSNKVFLAEEDWKMQNRVSFVFLLFLLFFLLQLLLIGFAKAVGL